MATRLGKTSSYKVKQLIFVILVLLIVLVGLAVFLFRDITQLWVIAGAFAIILFFLISRYDFLLTLKEYERAVIFRFGRVVRVGGPGWTFMIPVIESTRLVDLRTQTLDTPVQEVVTKDRVVVKIDAIIYLFIKKDNQSVINSVIEIDDYKEGAKQFVISSIRDAAGELTLPELISKIDKLNEDVKKSLQKITQEWGIFIDSVEIQTLVLPKELSDAYSAQKAAEQKKLARMEIALARKAEIDAVREAAEQLSDKAISYYYIRALERLGRGKSTKYLFPMELTQLASRLGGTHSDEGTERLLRQYAPAIRKFLRETGGVEKPKKKRASRKRPARKKKKRR